MTSMTALPATVPAQRTRRPRRARRTAGDLLATPWRDAQLPDPRRLPQATHYPPLALVELSRLR